MFKFKALMVAAVGALCFSDFFVIQQVYAKEKALIVGVFPRRNATVTHKLFKPMIKYLSAKLGREVRLVTTKNFKTFWQGVKAKKYDVVHYNQYHYIISHNKWGYRVILKNEEFGLDKIAGSIVVRKDSGLKSIKDLKGKKIVFGGGPKAMQSYIYATYLLLKGGLSKGDYTEAFSKNPPNAIFSAYYKQSAAAGSGDLVLRLPVVSKHINTNEMFYLARGEAFAHLPWAVRGDVKPELANKIQSILSGLKKSAEGKVILKKAKLTSLNIAHDKEFDPHRKIVKAVFGK